MILLELSYQIEFIMILTYSYHNSYMCTIHIPINAPLKIIVSAGLCTIRAEKVPFVTRWYVKLVHKSIGMRAFKKSIIIAFQAEVAHLLYREARLLDQLSWYTYYSTLSLNKPNKELS